MTKTHHQTTKWKWKYNSCIFYSSHLAYISPGKLKASLPNVRNNFKGLVKPYLSARLDTTRRKWMLFIYKGSRPEEAEHYCVYAYLSLFKCCELKWRRHMKLGKKTGNDVQVLPDKYEPCRPGDGTVIQAQKSNVGKATAPHTVSQTDLKFHQFRRACSGAGVKLNLKSHEQSWLNSLNTSCHISWTFPPSSIQIQWRVKWHKFDCRIIEMLQPLCWRNKCVMWWWSQYLSKQNESSCSNFAHLCDVWNFRPLSFFRLLSSNRLEPRSRLQFVYLFRNLGKLVNLFRPVSIYRISVHTWTLSWCGEIVSVGSVCTLLQSVRNDHVAHISEISWLIASCPGVLGTWYWQRPPPSPPEFVFSPDTRLGLRPANNAAYFWPGAYIAPPFLFNTQSTDGVSGGDIVSTSVIRRPWEHLH